MREILFKAKRKDNDEWVEGGFCHSSDGKTYIIGISKRGYIDGLEVVSETICQFTGLTDKNGIKIWENDFVEGLLNIVMKTKAIIVFKDGAFGLKWYRGNVEEFSAFTSICNISYEVIGNIFDDPELLKGE